MKVLVEKIKYDKTTREIQARWNGVNIQHLTTTRSLRWKLIDARGKIYS